LTQSQTLEGTKDALLVDLLRLEFFGGKLAKIAAKSADRYYISGEYHH
jgi:hypothetical protein